MRGLLIAGLLAFASPALAEPVNLPVAVADGATWTIESRRVRTDVRKGDPRRVETTSRYQATYRKAGDGGRLSLKPVGGFFLGDLPAGMKLDGFDIALDLEVDESLAPVRLVNWPQVREAVYRMIQGQDPQVAAGVRSLFDGLSDQQAAPMFLPQFAFLGLGQGNGLEPQKPLSYEDSLPNPLGGPPIKTRASFVLERHDAGAGAGEAMIVWTQALDEASMTESMKVGMKALVTRMKVPDDGKMDAAFQKMSMARNDRCRFVIDQATGLAKTTECASTIDIAAQGEAAKRTDTWTITQTLPEKR